MRRSSLRRYISRISSFGVCGAHGYDREFPTLPRERDHPPWMRFAEEPEAKRCKLDTIRDESARP